MNNIVHRDIKCENLLISLDGSLKVADFGFARQIDKYTLSETYCGSTAYTAPEVLEAKFPYDPKQSDTWSCGVIMYILLAGTMPFSKNQLFSIVKEPAFLTKKGYFYRKLLEFGNSYRYNVLIYEYLVENRMFLGEIGLFR